ncbi:ABC transporter permease [Halogeometricum sp. CBA1124]|uniref:ABC transporter permease n=1 Tax=Halogeometricum sp. CBA1124 TaxID=2668071 RepID=UPI0031B6A479
MSSRYVSALRLPTVRLARRNLSRNRIRTGLAALGIVIGVFAIAALGILGSVLELTAADSIGSLGNQVIVTPNADAGVQSLTDRDVQAIRRAAAGAEVIPIVSGGALAANGDRQTFATLYGLDDPNASSNRARANCRSVTAAAPSSARTWPRNSVSPSVGRSR